MTYIDKNLLAAEGLAQMLSCLCSTQTVIISDLCDVAERRLLIRARSVALGLKA